MIIRLKNIQMRGFRSFHSPDVLPLDSDVVLIYGKNGSGKTNLMSAIEFALTGTVLDLCTYTEDYPRCLKNVQWESQVAVKVNVATENQQEATIARYLDGRSVTASRETKLTKEESRFFAERCYLSQSRLSRLLELYQATDKDNPEQLLVRFVRELLGLDLLENITAGLYEAADVRRLENACANLTQLKHEQSISEGAVRDLNFQLAGKTTLLQISTQKAKPLVVEIGDPLPEEPWNAEGVKKRRSGFESRSVAIPLQKLQELQGRLNRIVGFLQAADAGTTAQSRGVLQERLSCIKRRQMELEMMFSELISGNYEKIPQVASALHQVSFDATILRRISVLETSTQKVVAHFDEEAKIKSDSERELAEQNEHTGRLKAQLKQAVQSLSSAGLESRRRHFEMLRSIIAHIHGEACPVCGRDYSEVSQVGLKTKVQNEIDKLGLDIEKLEASTKQQAELRDSLAVATQRGEAITKRLAEVGDRIAKLREAHEEAQRILSRLDLLKQQRSELDSASDEAKATEAQLKAVEIQLRQQEQTTQELKSLANEIGIGTNGGQLTSLSLAERASDALKAKVDELQKLSVK